MPPLIANRHEDVTTYLRRVLPSVAAAAGVIVVPDPPSRP
jgi:hypothetical protein